MAGWYLPLKHFHLLTVVITAVMLVVRFWWLLRRPAMLQQRWVRILPHANDTLLLLSGVMLVMITHLYPFIPQGARLTQKLVGVIIYIALGFVVLGRRPKPLKVRWAAFIVALLALAAVIHLAVTKIPFSGWV